MTLNPPPSPPESPKLPPATGWIDLINESVHTIDDTDIGDIEAVSLSFIVVKQGFVNIHYYYIPVAKVEGWDGNALWLKVTEDEVKQKYERSIPPDTSRYYTKDPPSLYNPTVLKGPTVILPRYDRSVFTTATGSEGQTPVFKCDLCNLPFRTEEELSNHVSANHQ